MAEIGARRLRVTAPLMVVVMLLGALSSDMAGIPLRPSVYAVNAVTISIAGLISVFAWRDRIGARWIAITSALAWVVAPGTTLATYALVHNPQLMVALAVALIAAPGFQISREWILGTTGVVVIAWFLLVSSIEPASADVTFLKVAVLGCAALANVVGLLQWRLLETRDRVQVELRSTNARLSKELAERKRAEEEREAFRDQFVAAQRNEAIGNLAAGIAHEMNNVLGGILTAGELLLDESNPAARDELTEDIVREARRGGALTHGLLAFARRGQYRKAPAQVDGMVEELCRVLPRTIDRRIEIERRGGTEERVDVDRAQMMQAVLNLAINGSDAMPDGGTLTLSTGTRDLDEKEAENLGVRPGRYVTVSVSDTGTGMDEETRRRAFEPFFTTKELGKGTGLGLSMVHGAVKAHGGTLHIESMPGQGTIITIYLPIHEGNVVQLDAVGRKPMTGRGYALIIDDEPIIRTSLGRLLERDGFTVVTAADGREGLAAFEARDNIALVLCDMNMPVMDGDACVRAIRRRSEVPIVVISGYAAETEAQALTREGVVSGFLEKPFTSDALKDAVVAALMGASGDEFPTVVRPPDGRA